MADIFACMRFSDATAQIAFLERAFGFAPHLIVPGEERAVEHAELRLGSGYIMAGDCTDDALTFRTPGQLGGKSTGMVYVAMPEVDEACERARAAGATILREPADTDYGSREFAARDPEGFSWSFGTYRPDGIGADPSQPAVFTGMRYARAREAIGWLTRVFGFKEQFVAPGEGDTIAHAQLTIGDDCLMLGSTREDDTATTTPAKLDGVYTHAYYVSVPDPAEHFERARAGGAEIIDPLTEKPYGGSGYAARDPEGYVWSFGSYKPSAQGAIEAQTH